MHQCGRRGIRRLARVRRTRTRRRSVRQRHRPSLGHRMAARRSSRVGTHGRRARHAGRGSGRSPAHRSPTARDRRPSKGTSPARPPLRHRLAEESRIQGHDVRTSELRDVLLHLLQVAGEFSRPVIIESVAGRPLNESKTCSSRPRRWQARAQHRRAVALVAAELEHRAGYACVGEDVKMVRDCERSRTGSSASQCCLFRPLANIGLRKVSARTLPIRRDRSKVVQIPVDAPNGARSSVHQMLEHIDHRERPRSDVEILLSRDSEIFGRSLLSLSAGSTSAEAAVSRPSGQGRESRSVPFRGLCRSH